MDSSLLRKYKYNILELLNSINSDIDKIDGEKKRILYITPHLSTGGMPQYLLKKIETFASCSDVYCILYVDNAQIYDVQKKKIAKFLGDRFIILGEDKKNIINIINDKICPDIIHFEEIPERFMDLKVIKKIYKKDRPYLICETPHSSTTSPNEKIFLPDRFIMVNKWMVDYYKELDVDSEILEYYLPPVEEFSKDEFRKKLGLSLDKKHIINVGLFTPGKNQSEVMEYAKDFIDYPVEFHFLGNMASNFSSYWLPLTKDIPSNCKIWGEVDNVEDFYKASDLFLFTSKWELAPIIIRESISHRLPILMNKLYPYMDDYDGEKYVHYLGNEREANKQKIKSIISI